MASKLVLDSDVVADASSGSSTTISNYVMGTASAPRIDTSPLRALAGREPPTPRRIRASLSQPQLRLWREIISTLRFLSASERLLQLCVKDFVPVAALDGRPKPRKRNAEFSRK